MNILLQHFSCGSDNHQHSQKDGHHAQAAALSKGIPDVRKNFKTALDKYSVISLATQVIG